MRSFKAGQNADNEGLFYTFLPPAFLAPFLGEALVFLGDLVLATFLGDALTGEAALTGDFLAAALAIVMFVVCNTEQGVRGVGVWGAGAGRGSQGGGV